VEWYDLTQPFSPEMPGSSALPAPEVETMRCVESDGVNVQRYAAPTHVGTHVDAPLHFVPGGETIDELPLERFCGTGTVADLERDEPDEIGLREFERAVERAGGVEEGDLLFVRTGWGERFRSGDERDYRRYPWLAAEIADWLLERGVKLLATDTISPDRPRAMRPDGWDEYPIHRTLLPEGVLIAEHLYLEAVAGRRLDVFGFPLKLRGGDGAPIRVGARERDGV